MRFRGQIIFWGAVISLPFMLISGDGEGVLLAIGIIGITMLLSFLLNLR